MEVTTFLYLLIISWFFLIGIHIAFVKEKIVVCFFYGIISCIFYIPTLIAMLGYSKPQSALNEYMGIIGYLFIPASFILFPIVIISIIVTLVKKPKSTILVLPDIKTTEHRNNINSELIQAVVNNDICLVQKLVSNGANPKEKNQSGYSAEDFARGHCFEHISKFFQEHAKQNNHEISTRKDT